MIIGNGEKFKIFKGEAGIFLDPHSAPFPILGRDILDPESNLMRLNLLVEGRRSGVEYTPECVKINKHGVLAYIFSEENFVDDVIGLNF